jgi:succinate dehydrogenase/fumarate reductase cytochrome b subunit
VGDYPAWTETTMLILQRLSGFAVLLLTLHFVHVLHHFFVEAPHDSPVFWAGMVIAVAVWILSFIGGCLLLKRSR